MAATYFDHNATTPLDPRVRDAMLPWLSDTFGNPSSIHTFGQAAREAVEGARQSVALLLGARPAEVVFTASGTEANNAVLRSRAGWSRPQGHIVVSALEHPSITNTAAMLQEAGIEVSRVAPDRHGRIDPQHMLAEIRPETCLVCLMLANNVVGTLQPVAEVAALCRAKGVPLLCDAVQAVGKIPVDVEELGVDFLSLGAHKFHGPLGAAALWLRGGAGFSPLLTGGSQERRRRAGTVNVPAVVGMGKAAELAIAELEERRSAVRALRERFETGLRTIADVVIHGRGAGRLPNTSHVAFNGVDGQALLVRLDLEGFAVSAGTACSSGTVEPSETLLAMGVPRAEALSALRVSFGKENTVEEVDAFLEVLRRQVAQLRLAAANDRFDSRLHVGNRDGR